jgi:hypothetical protein
LLQNKFPNFEAILPKAEEVAAWIYDNLLTDQEKLDVRAAGFLESNPSPDVHN